MNQLDGLSFVSIELTSRCQKNCWCCGRRKIDKDYPEIKLNYGDIDFELLKEISDQLPDHIIVSLHINGEPLLLPRLGEALQLFMCQIRVLDTNGILLVEKAHEIIDNLDTITVSVIQDDPIGLEQLDIVKEFLHIKGSRTPNVVFRMLGNIDDFRMNKYKELNGIICKRILHSPMGSYNYEKEVVIPEQGFCLEVISKLAIDRMGNVSPCVRFDPKGENIIGNLKNKTLEDIWNSQKRYDLVQKHIQGKRSEIPFCSRCNYWGCPRG